MLKNWLPYKLREENEILNCRWIWTADIKFTHPFFDETISHFRRLKENIHKQSCESSVDMLYEWSENVDAIAPTAIIFHVSRCGSTLLSQQLALDPSRIVLSEVPFLDELLRWGFRTNRSAEANKYFKAALKFYGTRREESQKHLFIKTDSWHIHFHRQLRELYPEIPFILLYRRPEEIIRSQQKQRGMQSVPGMIEPELFGFKKEKLHFAELDRHMAEVLETYYRAFLEVSIKDPKAFLCNYSEGMDVVFEKTIKACGFIPNEKEMELIRERGKFHAKKPEEVFEEPPVEEIPPAYLQKAISLYNELDLYRLTHRPTF